MNASMARRIRNAETILISAIDRQSGQRVWSRYQEARQRTQRCATPDHQGDNRMTYSHRAQANR